MVKENVHLNLGIGGLIESEEAITIGHFPCNVQYVKMRHIKAVGMKVNSAAAKKTKAAKTAAATKKTAAAKKTKAATKKSAAAKKTKAATKKSAAAKKTKAATKK